ALEQASHLGAEPFDAIGGGAWLREDRAAGFGQLGFARRLAIEQHDPELRLQIGNRIADDRRRPAEPSRRTRETAHLDHGQKDTQLVERRRTRVGRHIDFLERYGPDYASFLDRPSTLDRARSSIEPEHIARASSRHPRSLTGCDSRTGVLHAQRSSLHAPSSLDQASAEIQTLLL